MTHAPALRAFLIQQTGCTDRAEETLQEVYLRVHACQHQLRSPQKAKAWLFQIARHVLYDQHRAAQRQQRHLEAYRATQPLGADEESVYETWLCCVRTFVDQLPAPYRNALLATAYGTTAQKEYAEEQGLSYSTVKSRIQRARRQLKADLLACCPHLSTLWGHQAQKPSCCCV